MKAISEHNNKKILINTETGEWKYLAEECLKCDYVLQCNYDITNFFCAMEREDCQDCKYLSKCMEKGCPLEKEKEECVKKPLCTIDIKFGELQIVHGYASNENDLIKCLQEMANKLNELK
jgi:hypothetical protein